MGDLLYLLNKVLMSAHAVRHDYSTAGELHEFGLQKQIAEIIEGQTEQRKESSETNCWMRGDKMDVNSK